jgi:predicted phage tail protein
MTSSSPSSRRRRLRFHTGTASANVVHAMALDYPVLRRWLSDPQHRVAGVDHDRLREALEREDMELPHYLWAKDLATAHAFLDLWR